VPLAAPPDEPLGLLLLPRQLEQFERREHARGLLQIPRVVALEPGRLRTPRLLRDAAPLRQAKRLRLPGVPRLVVLYHPLQYPLARALRTRYERPLADRRPLKALSLTPSPVPGAGEQVEVWYFRPDPDSLGDERGYPREELLELDDLAVERAHRTVFAGTEEVLQAQTASLRARLMQLGVISHRPFVPGARIGRR
jgi:hypothetical protein